MRTTSPTPAPASHGCAKIGLWATIGSCMPYASPPRGTTCTTGQARGIYVSHAVVSTPSARMPAMIFSGRM